jgi:uncharacterized protein YkwD
LRTITIALVIVIVLIGAWLLAFHRNLLFHEEIVNNLGFQPPGTLSEANYAIQIYGLINDFRTTASLKPLVPDPVLGEIAYTRASEMAQTRELSLKRPDGSDWTLLLLTGGYTGRVAGENHSYGSVSPQKLFEGLIENPLHRPDLIYDSYELLGVGVKEIENDFRYIAIFFLTEPIDTKAYGLKVLELVNQERQAAQLSPLVWHEEAERAAKLRASEVSRVPEHTRPSGATWNSIFEQTGVNVTIAGENIARGQKDPHSVMEDWMASPGHRANIMRPDFTAMGVGVFPTPEASLSWVQLFVTP